MNDAFDKYPNIEIVADGMDPVFRIKYMECVREGGALRFVKHELKVPKNKIERLVFDLIESARTNGR